MNQISRLWSLTLAGISLLCAPACSKDTPQTQPPSPRVETNFKPHRIVLNLYEGHLHGNNFHYVAGPDQVKYLRMEQELSLRWDPTTSTYKIEEGNTKPRFVVEKSTYYGDDDDSTPAPVYGLLINYLDEQGKNINDKIGNNGAYTSYQHFFSAEGVKPTFDGTAEASDSSQDIIKYIYKDRDPWDRVSRQDSKSIAKDSPLGIKGYIILNKVRKTFDLKVQLWHAPGNAKTAGGVSPYGAPQGEMLAKGKKVLEFAIPITIYRLRDEAIFPDNLTAQESDFDADQLKVVESYKRAFGMSFTEFVHDAYWSYNGKAESEAAGIYWY